MKVKIINRSSSVLPQYATDYSAGMDLRAELSQPLLLAPFERMLVPTGLSIELPEGFEGQVRPRSGLALQHGLTVLNSPGTIDSDYRGELKVLLINLSNEPYTLQPLERIAQLVVARHERIEWVLADTLDASMRGSGGYGHTGKI